MQFIKKTSSSRSIVGIVTKLVLLLLVFFLIIFLLNKIDFPAPKKDIDKTIPIGIVLSISFLGAGKSILFSKKIIKKKTSKSKTNLVTIPTILRLELVFFINCIYF